MSDFLGMAILYVVIFVGLAIVYLVSELRLHQRGLSAYPFIGRLYDRFNLGRIKW
jgi:hypothetical protein